MRNFDYKFLLFIPILNVLATITTSFFPPGTFNPGTIRAGLTAVFIIYFFLSGKYIITWTNSMILLFLSYLLILVLLSSNILTGTYLYLKVFISFMMFPIGYYYINSLIRYNQLLNSLMVVMVIFILNMVISNILQLGTSDYLEETIYFGVGRVNITKTIAILAIISPLKLFLASNKNWRIIFMILIVSCIIIVLLGIKRSAIISLVLGFSIYFLINRRRKKSFLFLFYVFAILSIASLIFLNTFKDRLTAREDQVHITNQEVVMEEGRTKELELVFDDFKKRNIAETLFGAELFNEFDYYNTRRMLHTDYMILLHGAGIIGLILFITIKIMLVKVNFSKMKGKRQLPIINQNNSIILALVISSFVLSIAGTIYAIDLTSTMMLFLGAATRINKIYKNVSLTNLYQFPAPTNQ